MANKEFINRVEIAIKINGEARGITFKRITLATVDAETKEIKVKGDRAEEILVDGKEMGEFPDEFQTEARLAIYEWMDKNQAEDND